MTEPTVPVCHGLDTPGQIFFYEQEFYVFSNFSSFEVNAFGRTFKTAEHAYHWAKFQFHPNLQQIIADSRSAHDAFQFAQDYKLMRRGDWDEVKLDTMKHILWMKTLQHKYVQKKLLESGDRELVENSWRDDFWGWGPLCNGKNALGNLWMDIREEFKEKHVDI